jgi:agmatine deiminase
MNRRDVLIGAATGFAATQVGADWRVPGANGHVPAEDHPHEATFLQWPVSRYVYGYDGFLFEVQRTIASIANTISAFEPVILLADKADHLDIRTQVSEDVALWDIPTEDLWARDSGPLFAIDQTGQRVIHHLRFNGWGGKQVHRRDGQIAARVAERLGVHLRQTGLVGEPGGVDHDAGGLLIAHESSWVNSNRNPGLSRDQISARLCEAYGARQVIWSKGVSGQDITDYHIDSLARFTAPGRILINLPEDPDPGDPFHIAAKETHQALLGAGLEVEVIPEPVVKRVLSWDFVASYANYYVCNGAVIAAQFGDDRTDVIAQHALERHYPDREVILLNVDPLGEIGGGVHCATQQMPMI